MRTSLTTQQRPYGSADDISRSRPPTQSHRNTHSQLRTGSRMEQFSGWPQRQSFDSGIRGKSLFSLRKFVSLLRAKCSQPQNVRRSSDNYFGMRQRRSVTVQRRYLSSH